MRTDVCCPTDISLHPFHPSVDIRKVVGSTVHAKAIHVMAEAECNRINGSHSVDKVSWSS